MSNIHSISTILELPETLEEGAAKVIIVWFGYSTNWRCRNGCWEKLVRNDFVPCEEPEYEKIYKKLIVSYETK